MADAQEEPDNVDEVVLVGGSTRIPKIQQMLVEFMNGKELCRSINPDEAVAYGAAVQGAILSGVRNNQTSSLLLVDVTPLSLGIETTGRVMSTLIKRNTPIPVRRTKTYTTEEDWQTSVDIEVYEGERACTDANNKLGEFRISGIERARRGVPQVEVTFEIDGNGILTVSARDKTTGASANTTIQADRGRLTDEEVQRMVADAEANKAADAAFEQMAEARSELERFLYALKNQDDSNAEVFAIADEGLAWLDQNPYADSRNLYDQKRSEIEAQLSTAGFRFRR
jgi:molecular chaperone DnaK (HSP70)